MSNPSPSSHGFHGKPWHAFALGLGALLAPILIVPGVFEGTNPWLIWAPWLVGAVGGGFVGHRLWTRSESGDNTPIGGLGISAISIGALTVILRNVAPDIAPAVLTALASLLGGCFMILAIRMRGKHG